MTTRLAILERSRLTVTFERIALIFITISAFLLTISVSATSITYLLAWLFILASSPWLSLWKSIKHNWAAASFWILLSIFFLGLIYTTSPWNLALKDLQKQHWLLITPFLMLVLQTKHSRSLVINAFLAGMVLTLGLSLLKSFLGFDLRSYLMHKPLDGVATVFFTHIVQTFFMSIAAFIFGYRFLCRKEWRLTYLGIYLLMCINVLFLSDSGTGYLMMVLQFIYLGILRFSWKGMITGALIAILSFGAALSISKVVQNRVHDAIENYRSYHQGLTITSIGLRMAMWQNTVSMIKERPWLGYGTGGIRTGMSQILPPDAIKRTGLMDLVENTILNIILEFGFLGLLIFVPCILVQMMSCFYLPREYKHMMLFFLIAFLVGGLVNSFFNSFGIAHLYSLFAAVCFGSLLAPQKKTPLPVASSNSHNNQS